MSLVELCSALPCHLHLQHLFGSHSASTTEKISVIKRKKGEVFLVAGAIRCMGHLDKTMAGQAQEDLNSLVNSLCRGKQTFLTFQCRRLKSKVHYLLLSQKGGKRREEVWAHGRLVIPGLAQPKIVTVYHCLLLQDRGACHRPNNGGISRP